MRTYVSEFFRPPFWLLPESSLNVNFCWGVGKDYQHAGKWKSDWKGPMHVCIPLCGDLQMQAIIAGFKGRLPRIVNRIHKCGAALSANK